jgi:hypothetical protein
VGTADTLEVLEVDKALLPLVVVVFDVVVIDVELVRFAEVLEDFTTTVATLGVAYFIPEDNVDLL